MLARAGNVSHGRCGHGVRYSGTIINAHDVSQACVQSPRAHHVSPRAEKVVYFCASREPASRASSKPSIFGLPATVAGYWRAPGYFSHGRRGRGALYSGTIINAHHVSQACVHLPCAHHVSPRAEQIVSLTYLRCQRLSQGARTRRGTFRTAGLAAAYVTLVRLSTHARTAGRASAWAPRLSTRNAQRSNGQSMVQRTTTGASIKYLRRTTRGAAGSGIRRYQELLMCPFTTCALDSPFLVRASFTNKQNRTSRGWGLGVQSLCVEPEHSPCGH